ncbi:phage associated-antirepressor BRO [Acetobacter pasteurianus NBRC 3280]|uniref:Phage associated-antirepressor BRO n=1 Tax=Acetobacter pasteurianus NBRC 3278 TaxID=1226660 RepID=A0A401X1F6_ACEPA|nr:phage antirepressor [Acetobacter pasteurianus]GCD58211.1 phage associated-antirepressor BRO [Acetobacter pasteurianus NBRC 3277]GCD61683.1 phage associated-antirepressor BRO [Acetobacter pasteurianus NBRC 3278]GCD68059.1 phage associated-antirepressor BRO [Acetobacter pasteurianus NBRC 3280]
MSNIIPFNFEDQAVRVITRDGEPWFVLADVCSVLDIRNSRDAANRLDDDERGVSITDTLGGPQEMTVINESGLYSLVLTSRKPTAKRFKKWITSEVIPSIRKTGGYIVAAPEETPEELALRAMTILQATVERQKQQLAEAQPKAEAHDRIAGADGSLNITEAAKALQVRPKDLFAWLSCNGWIYKRPGSLSWLGYQSRTTNGDLVHKIMTILRPDGSEKVSEQVRITPKGIAKLAKLMPERLRVVA